MKLTPTELEFLSAWAREEWEPACYQLPAHRLQLAHGVSGAQLIEFINAWTEGERKRDQEILDAAANPQPCWPWSSTEEFGTRLEQAGARAEKSRSHWISQEQARRCAIESCSSRSAIWWVSEFVSLRLEQRVSFEIYLQCFERGRPGGIPRDAVKTLFPIVEAESEANYWKVWYDDTNYCHISVTPLTIDPSQLYALCVSRPCDDHRLWDSIFSIMGLGAVTLYFPGSAPPLVRSTIAGAQLPADMIEAMGKPRIVHSTTEILEIIQHA